MTIPFLPHAAEKAVFRLLEDLATPRSLGIKILIDSGEWDQLALLEVDPKHYSDPESLWRDLQATNLLKKLADLPTTVDRKAAALKTFADCEEQCFRSNRRLFHLTQSDFHFEPNDDLSVFFARARKIASVILGPCPSFNLEGRHGPGATFSDRGQLCTVPDKMSSAPTLTPDAWLFQFVWEGSAWQRAVHSSGRSIKFVSGNRFVTVPKDSMKDRGIAIEPSINVFYQLAYGRVIRQRLNRFGINLTDGQDIHRLLARDASTEGNLCTLDLKNASDTICKNLVKLLLPPSWFRVLDELRSKKTLLPGQTQPRLLEKFSSMGNGFTFELETLIFLCLILATIPGSKAGSDVFVFGDDLIFPTSASKDVTACLAYCGLTVNTRKSFDEGYFRESCGGDYFDSVAVRPFYLKSSPNEPHELISFANGLRRSCQGSLSRWIICYRAWRAILDGLPSDIRSCRGPEGLGDIVIHDDENWVTKTRYSVRYIRVYRPAVFRKVHWSHFRSDVILASALYGTESGTQPNQVGGRFSLGGVTPRGKVLGYKKGWVAYS
uniref:RNA-directed RNA polymerase n=1 Tax=Leviviridae sp. TaxID=2027243 RepID=A0A514DBC7_9VIRU|nr:MAG: RNA-dependent RNA polymerase [Leviviridae sp.]